MTPEPFTIAIPDARLADMQQRIRSTSWPGDFGNDGWKYGVPQDWLRDMTAYWADEFDWRAQEAEMNRLPHFRVEIDGIPLHFIHLRSGRPGAIPLILTHGWPWTFWDWRGVIAQLADGGEAGPAFDLVIPSLPGFTFSTPLTTTGLNCRRIAELWVRLMSSLGYDRFAAAGGDWGALITAELGHAHSEHLLAIHLTMPILPGYDHTALGEADFAPDEQWMLARNREAMPITFSHVAVQGSDPQMLAYALADSPVGTAAWIWERRRAWSDCNGDIIAHLGRDSLCTTASLYWLTNSIGSSMRIYQEQFAGFANGVNWPPLHNRTPLIPVPTGATLAPRELAFLPRRVFAEQTDLRRWQLLERGGHFLPAEEPDLLAAEYRRFFGEALPSA